MCETDCSSPSPRPRVVSSSWLGLGSGLIRNLAFLTLGGEKWDSPGRAWGEFAEQDGDEPVNLLVCAVLRSFHELVGPWSLGEKVSDPCLNIATETIRAYDGDGFPHDYL